jgi:glycogen phosphorylase
MSTVYDELLELTQNNLWWTWHPDIRSIFRDIDFDLFLETHENPLVFLRTIDRAKLEQQALDVDAPARIDRALRRLRRHMSCEGTWGLLHAGVLRSRPVVYFCMEFGIHESLPIYSGGLGILAGDHLKAAAHLGIPMVAVGMLYAQGYTSQVLNHEFWQEDVLEPYDIKDLPLRPAVDPKGNPVRVAVELPGRIVYAQVLEVWVGIVRLLLLDTRDPENSEADRALGARLYGGDQRMRIEQELILGVGGMRALRALGITPGVIHLNEGHCAFAVLELARHRVQTDGLDPLLAVREAGASTVFTTHTPVEAGHDHFPHELVAEHLGALASSLGLPMDHILGLGRVRPEDQSSQFLPTVLALRLARNTNAVSALHGRVARAMWQQLYPNRTEHEVPIGHVTNGVHVMSWMSLEFDQLLRGHLGQNWPAHQANPDLWAKIEQIDPAEIWELKRVTKARTLRFLSQRVARTRERLGLQPAPPLDPEAFTIGFARRFVPYKRPDLLFHDPDRLARIVNGHRPVNIIFAGRSHPADHPGKSLIQRVIRFTEEPRFRNRIAFVENYNIRVGRTLYQGVDAWLNNPRRPMEACGTSGMKVVMNAGLHVSVLDGWWAEAFDGENGFAIGTTETHARTEEQDARDAEALYQLLENEVIPLYYDRDAHGVPRGWVQRVQRSMRTLAWRFSADRMMKDYVSEVYMPTTLGESCMTARQ